MAHRRAAAAAAAAADTEPLLTPETTEHRSAAAMSDGERSDAGQPAGTSSIKNQVLSSLCGRCRPRSGNEHSVHAVTTAPAPILVLLDAEFPQGLAIKHLALSY